MKKRILSPIEKEQFKNYYSVKIYPSVSIATTFPNRTVQQITKIMFSFIWDRKPDKISRTKLVQNKEHRGLEMIDLVSFIKGLQINS